MCKGPKVHYLGCGHDWARIDENRECVLKKLGLCQGTGSLPAFGIKTSPGKCPQCNEATIPIVNDTKNKEPKK